MRRIIPVLLCIILIFSLTSCSNTNNNTATADEVSYNSNIEVNHVCFGLNENNGEYIDISIPNDINDYCSPIYSSYFKEGWINITIKEKETNTELFTIYASTNDNYKKYEKEKNYKILGTDGVYTVIWYEHDVPNNLSDKTKEIISQIQLNYTLIQETVTIKTPDTHNFQ